LWFFLVGIAMRQFVLENIPGLCESFLGQRKAGFK
jgi:hypothetical protein